MALAWQQSPWSWRHEQQRPDGSAQRPCGHPHCQPGAGRWYVRGRVYRLGHWRSVRHCHYLRRNDRCAPPCRAGKPSTPRRSGVVVCPGPAPRAATAPFYRHRRLATTSLARIMADPGLGGLTSDLSGRPHQMGPDQAATPGARVSFNLSAVPLRRPENTIATHDHQHPSNLAPEPTAGGIHPQRMTGRSPVCAARCRTGPHAQHHADQRQWRHQQPHHPHRFT